MLGIVVLTTALFSQSVFASNFSDVRNHKNAVAIDYLYENGVINGYSDGTFRPDQEVNRAEILKILIEGMGDDASSYADDNCFKDLEEGAWYVQYVCFAKSEGWVQGYGDSTFKPSQTVNKMEALKMLIMSQSLLSTSIIDEDLYDDVDNNAWYYNYVYTAVKLGLVDPSAKIGVIDNMSRGGISEMTYRAMRVNDEGLDTFFDAE